VKKPWQGQDHDHDGRDLQAGGTDQMSQMKRLREEAMRRAEALWRLHLNEAARTLGVQFGFEYSDLDVKACSAPFTEADWQLLEETSNFGWVMASHVIKDEK